jgi:hypothetical protein
MLTNIPCIIMNSRSPPRCYGLLYVKAWSANYICSHHNICSRFHRWWKVDLHWRRFWLVVLCCLWILEDWKLGLIRLILSRSVHTREKFERWTTMCGFSRWHTTVASTSTWYHGILKIALDQGFCWPVFLVSRKKGVSFCPYERILLDEILPIWKNTLGSM